MARVTHVKKAQQRYRTVPVLDADGKQVSVPVMGRDGKQKTTKSGRLVFQRQTRSDKSQPLPPLKCESCGKDIEIGTPYKHVTPKSGPYGGHKRNRHESCPDWRPSELSSSKMATVMAAQESFYDQLYSLDEKDAIQDAVNEVAEAAREVASEYEESADNIEQYFPSSDKADELRDNASQLEGWADELEQALDGEEDEPTVDHVVYVVMHNGLRVVDEEFEDTDDAQGALDTYADEHDVDRSDLSIEEEDASEPNEDEKDTWLEALRDAATNAVENCPL